MAANLRYEDEWENYRGGGEIEEELFDLNSIIINGRVSNGLATIREETEESVFSIDFQGGRWEDVVYVAVGKAEAAAMDALIWSVNNVTASTVVFLVYVFPETKFIPSPLGNLPISQVNLEHKEMYKAHQRSKRRDFLEKFINVCSASQVKVESIVIENDMEAKAILDLIPILNIRKLVIGASKSTLRRMRSRKGRWEVADEIQQNAPEFCEVKIICEGKEMSHESMIESSSSSSSPSSLSLLPQETYSNRKLAIQKEHTISDFVASSCFGICSNY